MFVGSMGLMEGKGSEELSDKFRNMFWRRSPPVYLFDVSSSLAYNRNGKELVTDPLAAMVANWKVWPIIQAVNFSIIPFQYRLPFQSTCSIGWNLFLSLLNAEYASPHLYLPSHLLTL